MAKNNGQRTTDPSTKLGAGNGRGLTPAEFIPLAEAAKIADSKPNCLRKHRTAGWLAAGLAHKDPSGVWRVDPKVIETIRPVRSRVAHSAPPPADYDVRHDLPRRIRQSSVADPAASIAAQAGVTAEEVAELLGAGDEERGGRGDKTAMLDAIAEARSGLRILDAALGRLAVVYESNGPRTTDNGQAQ